MSIAITFSRIAEWSFLSGKSGGANLKPPLRMGDHGGRGKEKFIEIKASGGLEGGEHSDTWLDASWQIGRRDGRGRGLDVGPNEIGIFL